MFFILQYLWLPGINVKTSYEMFFLILKAENEQIASELGVCDFPLLTLMLWKMCRNKQNCWYWMMF